MRLARTSSASDCSMVIMPSDLPTETCERSWWSSPLRMRARTASVESMISVAGQGMTPSRPGTSCCATMASRASDNCWRICGWLEEGNVSRMRETLWMVSLVWSVESTRWPVSAAVSAVEMVSASRISPTRMTSGDCRMMLRRVTAKSGVSRPTSICSMTALRLACWYSTGSSMVTTWAAGIDDIDERCERGRLAAAGGSREQNQALAAFGELGERRRQVQRFKRRNLRRQEPDAGRQRAALVMHVDAEAADAVAEETEIERLDALQFVELGRFEQRRHQAAHFLGIERRPGSRRQVAGDAQHGGRAGHQQNIGGVARGRQVEQLVERRRGLRSARRSGLLAGCGAIQFGYDFGKFGVVFAHGMSAIDGNR